MMPMICRHGLEETRCGHCCPDLWEWADKAESSRDIPPGEGRA